jgi:preprotein translocase subunit SecY
LANYNSWEHNLLFAVLIILFTYFYTAITVNPNQMAEDMKKNGGFIPGVKPGRATANFIDDIISKITLPGALALAIIAVIPAVASMIGVSSLFQDSLEVHH